MTDRVTGWLAALAGAGAVLAALTALARQGKIERSLCQQAIDRYEIAADAIAPWMA